MTENGQRFQRQFTTEQLVLLLDALEADIPLSVREWQTITRAAGQPADPASAARAAEQEAVAALVAQRLLVVINDLEPIRVAAALADQLRLVDRTRSAFTWICCTPLGAAPAFEIFRQPNEATLAAVTDLGTVEVMGGAEPAELFNVAVTSTLDRFDTFIGDVEPPTITSMCELRTARDTARMIVHITMTDPSDPQRQMAFFQTAPGMYVRSSNLDDDAEVETLGRDEVLRLVGCQFEGAPPETVGSTA